MGDNRGRHRAAEKKVARRRQRTQASSTKRKAQFVLATSSVTAAAVALGVAGPAFAVNPDVARQGCEFKSDSDRSRNIQTCTFYSNSLGRTVNVQIRASDQPAGGTEQGVYFLDGIGANNDRNTWANPDVGEVEGFSKGVNLVMPAGGAGEWMTDWQQPIVKNGVTTYQPKWDEFLGQELPEYLNQNFDVQKNNNAIVGVSMSGGPAIITALNNPTVFAVARSFSGFYQTDNAGGYQAIPYIQQTYTGISNGGTGMWGVPNTPGSTWAANDVSKRIAEAKANGQTIIISVGNGVPPLKTILALAASQGIAGIITLPVTIATGVAIEMGSMISTMILNAQAVSQGLPVRFKYVFGSHDFYSWSQTAPQDAAEIEAALAAAQAKETANANTLRVAGPSTTLAATNASLSQKLSEVTLPVKEALGTSSGSTETATGSTSTDTTTESTTPAPTTAETAPPATETAPPTEATATDTPSTGSAPTTGSSTTTEKSTPPATTEKSTPEAAPSTTESAPTTTPSVPTTTSESAPSTSSSAPTSADAKDESATATKAATTAAA